ncbi:PVC-type heme-binding CxxCH protein [Planctomicrobium sp. SH661]|uniref:PVC-type heme-binding CxxCH protein n=1 Tax=Planctomicrobium sp. SH661 TaxID=3448124 RepID=UPI003F5C97B1
MRILQATLVLFCCLASFHAYAEDSAASSSGPFSPELAAGKFVLDHDCRIDLVAAEPDVIDPVAIAFGADGKLWVVEYTDYPNGPSEGEPGRSRIRVLDDLDGNGRYENSRIFADKLLFANGLMLWKDGVIVTTDGKVLFLRDTDGDGKADETQVWFQGFQVENPQLRCNHPTLGIDNMIYVANGLRGGEIVPGESNPWKLDPKSPPVSLSGMDFRFDPLTGRYEAVSGMGQFGLTFDDWGNRFLCDNRHPCKQIMLEDADIHRVPWLQPESVYFDVSPAAENSRLYPISRTWTTSNLHANQFTAACGVLIYRGDALPAHDYGNCFVCEPTANLVHRDVIKPARSTFLAAPQSHEKEFLATKDEWFRPVNLSVGPDGALYVCDMYRAVIEHPQFMPDELKNRPDLLLGSDMGRIWRVSSRTDPKLRDFSSSHVTHLEQLGSADLVELLKHPNQWQRETAQRLLLERQDQTIEPELFSLVKERDSHWGASHALWVLDALNLLKVEHVAAGLEHPFAKRAALQLGSRHFADSKEMLEFPQRYLAPQAPFDEDPHLFEQILVNTKWKDFPNVARTEHPYYHNPKGAAILQIPEDGQHEWYCSMLVINAGDQLADVLDEVFFVLRRGETPGSRPMRLGPQGIQFLTAALARRNQPAELEHLLSTVFQAAASPKDRAWQRAVLSGILESAPNARTWLPETVAKMSPQVRQAYAACLNDVLFSFVDSAPTAKPQLDQLPILALLPPQETVPVLKRLAASNDLDSMNAAIDIYRLLPGSIAVPELSQLVAVGTPQIRTSAIAALANSAEGVQWLLDSVEAKHIAPLEIDPAIAKRFVESQNQAISSRATALLKQSPPEDRLKVLSEYASVLTLPADPHKGRVVFEKTCATCHRVGDLGVNVAPDISDSRTKTSEFLLTNILDPNRAVDNNYFSFTIADTEGRVETGVIASETSTAVTLKQPGGKVITIPRDEIDMMKNNGVSLMPVGLERTIPPQDMADLISFIKNWRYLDGQIPGEIVQPQQLK